MIINRAINSLMQSEMVSKVLQQEALVETILKAVTTSLEARDTLSAQYEGILRRVGLVTVQQLHEVRDELELLNQEADGLREQLAYAAQSNLELRRRAELAEAELAKVQEQLHASLKTTAEVEPEPSKKIKVEATRTNTSTQWAPTMTKKELIEIARELGMKVSTKIKKTDLIERLSGSTSH